MLQHERVEAIDRRRERENKTEKFQLLFLPEGGQMVEGIPSQVAFKAIDREGGYARNVIGKIYSKKDKKAITDIRTRHNGMGLFSFTPKQGEEYMARITHQRESYEFDLPKALPLGYVMQVNNFPPARLIVTIRKSNGLQADTLGFAASCRGQVLASQFIFTNDSTDIRFSIPKENLPEGIMQLTLFDHKGKILCERLAFIRQRKPEDQIGITLNKENINLNSAALNEITLRLTDSRGTPLPRTGVSVSVRDSKTELNNRSNESARINLLLSSDLKGYIENPEYYFEDADNARIQNLDLLMLVQGWKRYSWQEMSGVTPFTPQFKIEKGITIDGRITHLMNKKKPYANARLSYMLFGGTGKLGIDFDELSANEAGEFSTTLQFFGTRPIVIQSRNSKNKRRETYIQLYRNFRPFPRPLNPGEILQEFALRNTAGEESKEWLEQLETAEREKQLDEVVVEGKLRLSKRRLAHEDITIDVDRAIDELRDDGIEPSSVNQILERYDPYFMARNGQCIEGIRHKGRPLQIIYRNHNLRWKEKAYDRFNDNTIVSPIGMKTIVITEKAAIGSDSIGEAITSTSGSPAALITLHKDAHKKFESYGIRKSRIQGYNLVSSFYSPQYLMENPETYDGRRTLIWMPDLMTDEQGYATFEFYNSPTCREFIFDIQCVSRNGKTGSFYETFNEENTLK